MENFYYMESRYEVTERETSFEELEPTLNKLINLEVERLIADLFAEIMGGRREYMLRPEIDFVVTVRDKPKAVGEIKWGNYSKKDLRNFLNKTETIPGEKLFITKKKEETLNGIKILDAKDLASIISPKK